MRIDRGVLLATGTALLVLALSGCVPGANPGADGDAAGFWWGLWHGLISPITFLVSLFDNDVNFYEVHNNGNWYNTGFVLGAGILFAGGSSPSSSSRRH